MIVKQYTFSKTLPLLADIIAKVRHMEKLTNAEEMIYLLQIKGITEIAAQKIINVHNYDNRII